ncbi:MAG: HIT domain-containing protein [Candidatus Sabulitectum sp.]|nr:HIT domain-containing protein [Candidatus Sabulitectum sp.]
MTERLWAPWRYDYVTSPGDGNEECVFCGIGESDISRDRENLVLCRGEHAFVILNRYPYINGHLMIVPFRHVPDLSSLESAERTEIMEFALQAENALKQGMKCQGINGGWNIGSAGGAGIPGHFHLHMLPRWNGDTNFMSTVGAIRVVSQSLERAHRQLSVYFGGK